MTQHAPSHQSCLLLHKNIIQLVAKPSICKFCMQLFYVNYKHFDSVKLWGYVTNLMWSESVLVEIIHNSESLNFIIINL